MIWLMGWLILIKKLYNITKAYQQRSFVRITPRAIIYIPN